jgi:hypothetical protein
MGNLTMVIGILRENSIQRLEPLQLGDPLFRRGAVQDYGLTGLSLTDDRLGACGTQRSLNGIELMEHLFPRLACFSHFDYSVQMSRRTA